jgi:hypothetical protein
MPDGYQAPAEIKEHSCQARSVTRWGRYDPLLGDATIELLNRNLWQRRLLFGVFDRHAD